MSIKKGTELEYNEKIILDWLNNDEEEMYTILDIYNIVNKSFGLDRSKKVKLSIYCNALAKKSLDYKKNKNILYAMFDICLAMNTIKIIERKTHTNQQTKKNLFDLINKSMDILEGKIV
jgi:hypothetical protein